MSRAVRWIGLCVAGVLGLAVVGLGIVYLVTGHRMSRTWETHPVELRIPEDSASVAYGEHVYTIRGCADCHGEDLGGRTFIDEAPLARLSGTNLTAGEGGVADAYDVDDWARAVRHGVGPDGSALLFMPSVEFHPIGDEDLAALIAYIRSASPVDRTLPPQSVRPLGRILYLAGEVPLVHAELIDHRAPHPDAPEPGPTVAYGRYLARGCVGCHGDDYAGGPIPGAPPSWPRASNLTPHPEAGLGSWSREDFDRAMRRGRRPDGTAIDTIMPWRNAAAMTETEMSALWRFLQSLPAVSDGG